MAPSPQTPDQSIYCPQERPIIQPLTNKEREEVKIRLETRTWQRTSHFFLGIGDQLQTIALKTAMEAGSFIGATASVVLLPFYPVIYIAVNGAEIAAQKGIDKIMEKSARKLSFLMDTALNDTPIKELAYIGHYINNLPSIPGSERKARRIAISNGPKRNALTGVTNLMDWLGDRWVARGIANTFIPVISFTDDALKLGAAGLRGVDHIRIKAKQDSELVSPIDVFTGAIAILALKYPHCITKIGIDGIGEELAKINPQMSKEERIKRFEEVASFYQQALIRALRITNISREDRHRLIQDIKSSLATYGIKSHLYTRR